jgi:hypothetical protein
MMLAALINWRPIAVPPETHELFTAVLAFEDDEGRAVLEPTLYVWQDGCWVDEIDGRANTSARWWVPESELVAQLNVSLAYGRRHAAVGHDA